ncbi:PREDICTED: uncharacterized protein LOC106125722 isoform X2 [Papilio xuthus]|uniref:Uncharacterized protein LOC106125722 isoform X2 n=1 Tax=Papilio xuthus TaxID=66420 RepID=A0AAJ6ZSQ0_PAPXU|nr:PREDICTED: uncharacterized protein LOC106125722 isoform X2 [Papilio xuthus]
MKVLILLCALLPLIYGKSTVKREISNALWAAAAALPEIYDLDAFQDENQEGRLLRERREPQLFWNSHSDGSDLNDDLDDGHNSLLNTGRNGLHNGVRSDPNIFSHGCIFICQVINVPRPLK